jgi:hypothetical protein
MRIRWIGVAVVLLAVVGLLLVKQQAHRVSPALTGNVERPSVLLVADLREAGEPGDACAEIIHAVREASKRGIRVQELMPDSGSDLLQRYRVLTAPTVLVLSEDGRELGRFEGESRETVNAIRTRLATLARNIK